MELQQQESMMVYQQMQQQAAMAQSAAEARSNGNLDDIEDGDSDLMYALELARQEQVMGEQEAEEGESFDSEDMDYEQLLALGERIGDVARIDGGLCTRKNGCFTNVYNRKKLFR